MINTAIGWTNNSLNAWWGCVEVSPGCDNCYARVFSKRVGRDVWGIHARRFFTKGSFRQALAWNAKAKAAGARIRVFVQSMSDLFEVLPQGHEDAEEMDRRRKEFFEEIIPACDFIDFQLLTKRVGNVAKLVPASWLSGGWPANAWMGISVVNQIEADRDIPKLLALPAPTRFLSCEPLIAEVDLRPFLFESCDGCDGAGGFDSADPQDYEECKRCEGSGVNEEFPLGELHWVIIGGESGAGARSMVLGWAKNIVRQCQAAGAAVFMKQLGGKPTNREGEPHQVSNSHGTDLADFPEVLRVQQFPEAA